jgi:tRNA (cytidine32/uridine32-2'-O)-methyltransferase
MAELSAGDAARRLVAESARGGVALVFGRERTGLENEELQRCHAAVTLPANPEYSSLNVAAAVQILAYELRLASLAAQAMGETAVAFDPETEPASQRDMESFFEHLMAFMGDIDFHKGHSPAIVEQRLRRLFLRAQPSPRELRILRGILSDSQRLLRLTRPT